MKDERAMWFILGVLLFIIMIAFIYIIVGGY